jgi:hypothetical protein
MLFAEIFLYTSFAKAYFTYKPYQWIALRLCLSSTYFTKCELPAFCVVAFSEVLDPSEPANLIPYGFSVTIMILF